MQLKEERVGDVYQELDDLIQEYYDTTVASKDLPPLDMDWFIYTHMNENELVRLFTARDEKLAGFVMYHVYPHMHHKTYLIAVCDRLAVRVDARGHGIGRALMEYAEPFLREAGVKAITHSFRTIYVATKPLFPKLGYKLIELGYMKELD